MKNAQKLLSRIIVLCIAVCYILCLNACAGNESQNTAENSNSSTTVSTNSPSVPSHTNNTSVAPTDSSPVTTEHRHNYTDYKCADCGALQEDHLSDYLINWVQKNGTANGETISVDVTINNVLYGLTYNKSGKYFFFSLLDSQYDDFLSLKFTSQTGTYEIAYLQGEESNGREIYGTIYAPEFTKNTPIAVDTYHGPSDQRPNAAENARICTGLMLDFLKQFLAENNVGITLQDLGFTAY